jgi:hypothetical protein
MNPLVVYFIGALFAGVVNYIIQKDQIKKKHEKKKPYQFTVGDAVVWFGVMLFSWIGGFLMLIGFGVEKGWFDMSREIFTIKEKE